jgi:hypothetical protein
MSGKNGSQFTWVERINHFYRPCPQQIAIVRIHKVPQHEVTVAIKLFELLMCDHLLSFGLV